MEKAKKYVTFFCLLTVLIISGCSEDNPLIPPAEDHSPMWPMAGCNARHTGNPNSIKVNIPPVNEGKIYWIDTIGTGYFSDGAENCIDAAGNIYHLSNSPGKKNVIKFKPDGSIIWEKDSLFTDAFHGLALSKDEKKIYYQDFSFLTCLDSSGNVMWKLYDGGAGASIPIIGRDETIYCFLNGKFTAVSTDGVIKWQISDGTIYGWPAIDRENNIYFYNFPNTTNIEIVKANEFGSVLWKYQMPFRGQPTCFSFVIDGYNNIYSTINGNLNSLDKYGSLRWSKSNISNCVPAITSDNKIIVDSANYITVFDTSGTSIRRTFINEDVIQHSIVVDDANNSYFFYEILGGKFYACSVDNSGNKRWTCELPSYWWGYPGPTLSPKGFLFGTPKRPSLVFSLK